MASSRKKMDNRVLLICRLLTFAGTAYFAALVLTLSGNEVSRAGPSPAALIRVVVDPRSEATAAATTDAPGRLLEGNETAKPLKMPSGFFLPGGSASAEEAPSVISLGGPLKSAGKYLAGTVAWKPAACEGVVTLVRTPCNATAERRTNVSHDPRWDAYLKEFEGPDAFRVVVTSDQELLPLRVVYSRGDSCEWQGRFQLRKGASGVKILAKWDTDNYNGISETIDTVTSFRNKYYHHGFLVGDCVNVKNSSASVPDETLEHRFVRVSERERGDRFKWWSGVRGSEWRWVGDRSFDPGPTESCAVSKTSVLFVGDSQVRTVWRHWQATLTRSPVVLWKTFHDESTFGEGHKHAFDFNVFLENIVSCDGSQDSPVCMNSRRMIEAFDVVVLGFGAWPANSGWTHQRVFTALDRLFAAMRTYNATRFIWIGSPAWPKPRANSPGFRITNQRLRLWNDRANDLAREHHIAAVPFFWIALPHVKLHRGDGMHYDNSIVLHTVVEQLAPFICDPFRGAREGAPSNSTPPG
eukprot:gene11001-16917_t